MKTTTSSDPKHYYSQYLSNKNAKSPKSAASPKGFGDRKHSFNVKQQNDFSYRMATVQHELVEGRQIFKHNAHFPHSNLLDRALERFLIGDAAHIKFGNVTKSAVKVRYFNY
jgi:hypothetical protein